MKEKKIDNQTKEKNLIAQLLKNKELFQKAIVFLQVDFFETPINRLIVEFIIDYYESYRQTPTADLILMNLETEIDVEENYLDVKSTWPHDFLNDTLNAFIKNMKMRLAIESSIELLPKEDYAKIEKEIKDAVNVELDVNLGVSVSSDKEEFRTIFEMITSQEQTVPSGWFNIDKHLDGGVTRPSLNYLLAKSGGGKSVGLINLAWNYIQMSEDVLYISLELKQEKILKRYFTHAMKVPSKELEHKELELFQFLQKCDKKGYGKFTVEFFQPNTLSSKKLELFVRNYIDRYGKVPILLVDYAGLMIPNNKNWQGMFEKDKFVAEELRAVGIAFDTVVWTADQFNRSAAGDTNDVTEENIQGGISKIQSADNVIAFIPNAEARSQNILKAKLLKTRDSGGVGKYVTFVTDWPTLTFEPREESVTSANGKVDTYKPTPARTKTSESLGVSKPTKKEVEEVAEYLEESGQKPKKKKVAEDNDAPFDTDDVSQEHGKKIIKTVTDLPQKKKKINMQRKVI